jgi:hypothetical protein
MAIEKARTRKQVGVDTILLPFFSKLIFPFQLLEENLVLRRDLEEALAGQITGQSNPLPHTSSIDSSSSSETMSTDPFVISDSVQFTSLEYAYLLFQFPAQPILKQYLFADKLWRHQFAKNLCLISRVLTPLLNRYQDDWGQTLMHKPLRLPVRPRMVITPTDRKAKIWMWLLPHHRLLTLFNTCFLSLRFLARTGLL